MLGFYPYLRSSLFRLEFEKDSPYSYEEFLSFLKRFISRKEWRILEELPLRWEAWDNKTFFPSPVFMRWQDFNIALKNALVELRATAKKISPKEYLRQTSYSHLELERYVYPAFKSILPDEAERIFDKLRWDFLEEQEKKYLFDFNYLLIYALKLLILIRWQKIKEYSSVHTLKEIIKNE